MKCNHCGQEIKSAEAAAHASLAAGNPQPQTDRKYIDIPAWSAFRDRCLMILASPNCTDTKWRDALTDFPKTLARFSRLTEGQWKFFCVIHKNVLGAWPPNPEEFVLTDPPKVDGFGDADLDKIPF